MQARSRRGPTCRRWRCGGACLAGATRTLRDAGMQIDAHAGTKALLHGHAPLQCFKLQGTLFKYGPGSAQVALLSGSHPRHLVLVGGLGDGFFFANYTQLLAEALEAEGAGAAGIFLGRRQAGAGGGWQRGMHALGASADAAARIARIAAQCETAGTGTRCLSVTATPPPASRLWWRLCCRLEPGAAAADLLPPGLGAGVPGPRCSRPAATGAEAGGGV